MSQHSMVELSATAVRLTPNGIHSGIDITLQNVNETAYVFVGGEGVTTTNYALQLIDTPAAGIYSYSLRATQVAGGSITFGEVNGPVLCIMELGK